MLYLNETDRDEFLFLHKQLMLFTNKQFGIYKKFKSIDDINIKSEADISDGITPIREKMYDEKNITEFCETNKSLTGEQISTVKNWKFVYSDEFFIIKHLKNETVLITTHEDKLYGVLGISGGLDEFFPSNILPAS